MSNEVTDEYAGQGGAFERDPVTGKRTLIERTHYPDDELPPDPGESDEPNQEPA